MKLAQSIEEFNLSQLEAKVLKSPGNIGAVISDALVYVFTGAAILLLIYLVSAGFQYMTSRGDPKQMAMASGKITNALVGLLIVLMAYWIVQLVGQILGVDTIGETFE